jgi:protein-disulfide isomerase
MFCIISFIVLSILGIFSASNRILAKEALDCVFRRITLRPCNTGFDQKMKAKLLGMVISRSEKGARFINKNFEMLSWLFFILLLTSSFFAIRGIYYFYRYGSCNGLNQTGVCVFDPKGENNKITTISAGCDPQKTNSDSLTLKDVNLDLFPVKNPQAKDKIVFIGCYECDFTRKVYPLIKQLTKKFEVSYTFAHFPTKGDTQYLSEVGICVYQQNPDKYWQLNDSLFAAEKTKLEDKNYINQVISNLGIDSGAVQACLFDARTKATVSQQVLELEKTGMYGTPTIFINGSPLVGPKPYRVYAILLKGLFYWLQ